MMLITWRLSLKAATATAVAAGRERENLPPKPPPARRQCTLTRLLGRPSAALTAHWTWSVDCVDDVTCSKTVESQKYRLHGDEVVGQAKGRAEWPLDMISGLWTKSP